MVNRKRNTVLIRVPLDLSVKIDSMKIYPRDTKADVILRLITGEKPKRKR